MPHVFIAPGAGLAGAQGQHRLGAIQGLDAGLFIQGFDPTLLVTIPPAFDNVRLASHARCNLTIGDALTCQHNDAGTLDQTRARTSASD